MRRQHIFAVAAVLALTGLPAYAADLEVQVVDKNCFIEIFEDDNFDVDGYFFASLVPVVKGQEEKGGYMPLKVSHYEG